MYCQRRPLMMRQEVHHETVQQAAQVGMSGSVLADADEGGPGASADSKAQSFELILQLPMPSFS